MLLGRSKVRYSWPCGKSEKRESLGAKGGEVHMGVQKSAVRALWHRNLPICYERICAEF